MRVWKENIDIIYIEELIRLGKMDEFIDKYDHEIVIRKLINTFKIEGHEAGIAEGRKMLSNGFDVFMVSENTGLSIEEIKNIEN